MNRAEAEALIAKDAHANAERNRNSAAFLAERLISGPVRRARPTTITDAPEHRGVWAANWELREQGSALKLSGYASTFEPYEMHGGPAKGGWIEQIARTAFDKTLRGKPDLHLLINHEGMPLARTKSGTLHLSVDDHGLLVEAMLDREDPDVQRLEGKMKRKDMDEMSFAFRVIKQTWTETEGDPTGLRTIVEVSLHKGDVSVVNFGANPTTHAELANQQRRGRKGSPSVVKPVMATKVSRAEAAAIVAADSATAAVRRTEGDEIVKRALEMLNGRPAEVPADRVAAEQHRRAEVNERLAKLAHAIQVREATSGRRQWAARAEHQRLAEDEQQRRQAADERQDQLRCRRDIVDTVKARKSNIDLRQKN